MRLDLSGLLKEKGAGLDYSEDVAVDFPKDELDLAGPVKAALGFTNTGDAIWMQGKISAPVKLECSRCLKEYVETITARVEEQLKQGARAEDEDIIFEIDDSGCADLSEIIRQSLLLNIPIKNVCSKTCKGLLKDGDGKKAPDPRLAKLKEINFKGEK